MEGVFSSMVWETNFRVKLLYVEINALYLCFKS